MNNKRYSGFIIGGILILLGIFLVVSFNGLVKKEEKVKLQWNEVQNSYQRRLDLIPTLINTVQGGANFEKNLLEEVTAARAKANFVNVSANDVSAKGYEAQSQAQNELAASANRLLIQVEKYPDLQGTKPFLTLQTQLERTELRIKIARKDFNESIQTYNSSTRGFPTSLVAKIFGFKTKDGFQSDAGAEKATEIKFK
jgi:LemA protein